MSCEYGGVTWVKSNENQLEIRHSFKLWGARAVNEIHVLIMCTSIIN